MCKYIIVETRYIYQLRVLKRFQAEKKWPWTSLKVMSNNAIW